MTQVADETMYEDRLGRLFPYPVINMAEDGALVLPPEVLKALGVTDGETFTFEVDETDGSVTLYAVGSDDWLYEEPHLSRLRAAVGESGTAQMRQSSEEELRALAPSD